MTIYLAGSSLTIADPIQAASTIVTTDTRYFDPQWVGSAISIGNGSECWLRRLAPLSEVWLHFEVSLSSTGSASADVPLVWLTNADRVLGVRLEGRNNGRATLRLNLGADWVLIGEAPNTFSGAQLFQIDVNVIVGATGRASVFINKVLVFEFLGDTSAIGAVSDIALGYGVVARFSQIIVADEPTLFSRVKQVLFTGNGALQQWDGSVNDINEPGQSLDSFISTAVGDAVSTFTAPERTGLTEYQIDAVGVHVTAQRGGVAAPSGVRPVVRVGGVVYEGANMPLSLGVQHLSHLFPTNPATGQRWTTAAASSATLEFGVKSEA